MRWISLMGLLTGCSAGLEPDEAHGPRPAPAPVVAPSDPGPSAARPRPPPPARIGRLSRQELDAAARSWLGTLPNDWPALPVESTDTGFSTGMGRSTVGEAEAVALERRARLMAEALAPSTCDADCVRSAGRRAYRRMLEEVEVQRLVGLQGTHGSRAVFEALFQSPYFLFHVELPGADGRLDDHTRAAALALALWGAPPDDALSAAADAGTLDMASEIRRLQSDPRYRTHLRRFAWEWLGLDRLQQAVRDPLRHPDYDLAELASEAEAWLATWAQKPGLQALLTGDWDLPEDGPRAGILTHPAFLSTFANAEATSPTRRGIAIMERLLCEEVRVPLPGEVDMSLPPPVAGLTTRARFEALAKDPLCNSCHARFDPMGFALEAFDEVGAWRTEENGVPIDSSGALLYGGVEEPVAGAVELAEAIAESTAARRCFVEKTFRWFLRRTPRPIETPLLDQWAEELAEGRDLDGLVFSMLSHPLQQVRAP
ncbi:MAG: DUF1588 domain-containing protein [Myxococcota bacterium]